MMLLKNIRLDIENGCYIGVEAASTYLIAPELYADLESFLKLNHKLLIADWYRQLPDADKIKVQCRTGHST